MKFYRPLFCAVFLICFIFCYNASAASDKWTRLVEESAKVLTEIQKMPDQSIPEKLLKKCEAIAIFPSTVSAGLGIGGKYGQGIIMVRNNSLDRWSNPAIFTLAGGSIGWQIGGQATDVILLIMNRRSVDGILQGKLKLGADASVAAGPVGRDAEASLDVQLKGGILSYSRSRGLFVGVKLEGAVITQHWDGNQALYGKRLSAEEILIENRARMLESAGDLLRLLK
jgi:lipid-binding SYLF domain-containing protein